MKKALFLLTAVLLVLSGWLAFRLYDRDQYYSHRLILDASAAADNWRMGAYWTEEALARLEKDDQDGAHQAMDEAALSLHLAEQGVKNYYVGVPAIQPLISVSGLYAQEIEMLRRYSQDSKIDSQELELQLEIIHADVEALWKTLPAEYLERAVSNEITDAIDVLSTMLKLSGMEMVLR